MEASGTIAALPADEKVLNDEEYKKRGFKVGDRVAVVSTARVLRSRLGLNPSAVKMTPGVHAEYASVPWLKVYSVPNNVSLLTAGAGLLQGASASSVSPSSTMMPTHSTQVSLRSPL